MGCIPAKIRPRAGTVRAEYGVQERTGHNPLFDLKHTIVWVPEWLVFCEHVHLNNINIYSKLQVKIVVKWRHICALIPLVNLYFVPKLIYHVSV